MLNAYEDEKDLYSVIAQLMYDNKYEDNLEFYPEGTVIEVDGQKITCGYKTHKNKAGKKRRSAAKTVLLGLLYGRGAYSIAEQLGKTKEEGQQIIDTFFKSFPKVKTWVDNIHANAKKLGYVEGLLGRRRHLPDIQLPPYNIRYTSSYLEKHTLFNPFIICDSTPDNALLKKYESMLDEKLTWKQVDKVKKDALKEGVEIISNNVFISRAERQSVNAVIQGCLDENSLIYTKSGVSEIKNYVNQNIEVWDGKQWTNAIVLSSGKKQKCVITTSIGQKLICSPNHKFLTINTRGNEKFKELKDIKSEDRVVFNYNAPHINNEVSFREMFNFNYNTTRNKHNYSFDDIKDNYARGQILGRIASDGSYIRRHNGGSSIKLFVAEHEYEVLEFLKKHIPFKYRIDVEQKKNQKLYTMVITSQTLVDECLLLDIKHQVPKCFLQNTDLLKGFISGFFDGDGSVDSAIKLTFGTQCDFTNILNQLQDCLSIFGIRSRKHKYKGCHRLEISNYDAKAFIDNIGLLNSKKVNNALKIYTKKENKTFNFKKVVTFKNIEFTDEYIDMYDVCNTEQGYFVVNGLITHNSAATLTKLAMINIYNDKELTDLGLRMLIPIHDEILCTCPKINAEKASERLVQVMIDTAKPYMNVPMSCDPYVVDHWYWDELQVQIQNEFEHLLEGDEEKGIEPDFVFEYDEKSDDFTKDKLFLYVSSILSEQ